ncbi:MAG TPA: VOC family protein [Actinophytocola sp.]|uniref:VOC family protein n=1 Tax=Actinophytocola sp. TaxID=1872138 RepID=UPI002DB9321B|nr:VOC family protein [Actinophytocola sp.]HEU5475569.1 VOC family protein [Actinophytocola sp.]
MLKDSPAYSAIAVNDLAAARRFYGTVLGLDVTEQGESLWVRAGAARIELYPRENHTPADYTVLNFPVDDVEHTVAGLREAGVVFEQYDLPGLRTDERGIHVSGELRIAWFKDPAGNVLAVLRE